MHLRSESEGALIGAEAALVVKDQSAQGTGLPAPLMAVFDLDDLGDFVEAGVEDGAVGDVGEVEQAIAPGPGLLGPFGGEAIGIAPGVGGIVEGAGVDDRPVEEVLARVVGVAVVVEEIDDGEFAGGEDEAIVGMGRGQLIEVVADVFEFAA